MKNRWLAIPVVVIALVAVLWAGSDAAVTAGPSAERLATLPPQAIVGEFYAWYLDMLDAEVLCHPLLDGAYQHSPYLSAGLVSVLDGIVADSCGMGLAVDPLLCAVDVPFSMGTRIVNTGDTTARVLVYGRYPTESPISETRVLSVVELVQEDSHWVLDEVQCR